MCVDSSTSTPRVLTNRKLPQYFAGLFCLGSFVFCFLFMEETNFYRKTMSSTIEHAADTSDEEALDHEPVSSTGSGKEQAKVSATSHVVEAGVRGRPFVERLGTRINSQPWRAFKEGFVQPLLMLKHPVVWFAALQYGIMQVWYNCAFRRQELLVAS